MKSPHRAGPSGKGQQGKKTKPHGSVTDALREEAERGWADADRKVAKGVRRAKAKRRAAGRKPGAGR